MTELITQMSKKQQDEFIRFLNQKNKRHDTRNVDLFKAYLQGNEQSIRSKISANAFNGLKKRLSDSLLDFLAKTSLETEASNEVEIIRYLILARKMFILKNYKLAFKLLKKQEEQAIQIQDYSLLNEIYHTYIQYSFHDLSPDQEEIFEKFETNKSRFIRQENINMAYAAIKRAFIRQTESEESFESMIRKTFNRFGISEEEGFNFKSLYQLAQIADMVGEHRKDYHSVDLFFVDQLNRLQGSSIDNEQYLVYHIDVLFLVANIHFRKRQFTESLHFLERMLKQMERFEKRYYHQRLIPYTTLLALNLNFTEKHKEAQKQLETLLSSKMYAAIDLFNPQLVMIMIHFQQGDLRSARRLMADFDRSDQWYERNATLDWILYKKYIEILLHIELGNVELVDSRIKSLIRRHGDYFRRKNETHVFAFLKLIKKYCRQPDQVRSEKFIELVDKTITWRPQEEEDIFLMCFYAWLKAKMENQDLYKTTINLVKLQQT